MSGKAIRETLGFIGVIASLVFVGMEIRQTTLASEREAVLDRSAALTAPFLSGDSPLPSILARIKAVDGLDPLQEAFMDRYSLRRAGFLWGVGPHLWGASHFSLAATYAARLDGSYSDWRLWCVSEWGPASVPPPQ